MSNIQETTTLHNGIKMPWLGFGVFKVKDGEEVVNSVKSALEVGYRSIDTAAIYGNEAGVGQAIAESSVPREDLFITTKVWNSNHGYEETLAAFDESMKKLGLDYLDLYLIHWPLPSQGKYLETWKALEQLYKDGRVRAIVLKTVQQKKALLKTVTPSNINLFVSLPVCHVYFSER